MGSLVPDLLDRQIIHALKLDGRVSFSRVAELLGVSDQTVARRYRRLHAADLLRVVGASNALNLGHVHWHIRLRCTADAAGPIATALAKREDTFWVRMLSGGTEVSCVMHSWTPEERDDLLLEKLPRTGRVVSVAAHSVLNVFFGDADGWQYLDVLTPEQQARLRTHPGRNGGGPDERMPDELMLDERDRSLFAVLARDGRASYTELAGATGWSESTVRRRMEVLSDAGVLYYDVDVPAEAFGYRTEAYLWMTVAPSALASIGQALTRHPEVAFVCATTGPANIFASVVCRNGSHLYRYLTHQIGALEAVQVVETAPIIRTLKRSGAPYLP